MSTLGPVAIWYVVFFVLGFVALAGLWAVAGSLASRQEDLGSTTMPGQIISFAPYMLAVTAVLLVRFAARLDERTLMRTERKIGFGEALRLSE